MQHEAKQHNARTQKISARQDWVAQSRVGQREAMQRQCKSGQGIAAQGSAQQDWVAQSRTGQGSGRQIRSMQGCKEGSAHKGRQGSAEQGSAR